MSPEIAIGLPKKILVSFIYDEKSVKENDKIMFDRIISVVELHTKIDLVQMKSNARNRKVVVARQIAMYLIYKLTSMGYTGIGKIFNRDHSTVIYSKETVQDLSDTDKQYRELLTGITREVEIRSYLNF